MKKRVLFVVSSILLFIGCSKKQTVNTSEGIQVTDYAGREVTLGIVVSTTTGVAFVEELVIVNL